MDNNEKILKEYIKKALIFEYGDALGPYDMATPADMAKIFVKPFTDVAKTAEKVIGQLSTRSRSMIKILTKGIISIVVPGISVDYSTIYKKEKGELRRLEQKYGNVLQHTRDSLKNDARLLAFLLAPTTFLSGMVSIGSVQSARKSLLLSDALTGPNRYIDYNVNTLLRRLKRTTAEYEKYIKRENKQLNEEKVDNVIEDIKKFIMNDKTQDLIRNSQIVRTMSNEAERLIERTINELRSKINEVSNLRTFENLEAYIGDQLLSPEQEKTIPEDELNEAKELLVKETKESMLETYRKLITANLTEIQKNNVPEDSPLIEKYVELQDYLEQQIDKISA